MISRCKKTKTNKKKTILIDNQMPNKVIETKMKEAIKRRNTYYQKLSQNIIQFKTK